MFGLPVIVGSCDASDTATSASTHTNASLAGGLPSTRCRLRGPLNVRLPCEVPIDEEALLLDRLEERALVALAATTI